VEADRAALLVAMWAAMSAGSGAELFISFGVQRSSSRWMMSLLTRQGLRLRVRERRGGRRSIALRFIDIPISMYSLMVVDAGSILINSS
jgi:hypothetical protein